MRKLASLVLTPLALGMALTTTSLAHGVEKQWQVGIDGGWSAISWADSVFGGWGGGAHMAYGLTDAFNLMVELTGTSHPVFANRPQLAILSGAAGAAYTLDITQWVPYFGLLVGGYRFSGADLVEPELKLGFQIPLGVDYRFDREWAVGVQLRYHTFSDEPFSLHYMTSMARVEYMWGW